MRLGSKYQRARDEGRFIPLVGTASRQSLLNHDLVLAECLQSLPEVYQSALRLYYWMGASIAEVADVLDLPENTVKSYLHRSRQLLDGMLNEKGYSHV